MWKTNLKVAAVGGIVIVFYTVVAQIIPQLQSEVPETLDLSGGFSPDVLVAAGEGLFDGAGGCTACHGLGTRAPNLRSDHAGEGTIGARCGTRGLECKEYLYQSLTDPNTYLVDGFTGIMPDASRQLSDDQIWALVAYLQVQGGEVTVTAADVGSGEGDATASGGGAASGGPTFGNTKDPRELLTNAGCLACHAIDGPGPPIGPSFDGMGSRTSVERIRRGILDPNAEIAEGFDTFAGTMPAVFGDQFTAAQLEAIVQFLASRQ